VKYLRLAQCLLLAAFAATLSAQTQGEITGRVADPSGAGVPGATLTLTNPSTNAVRTTTTTGTGDYTFPAVAPGFYNLKTEHTGFKAAASNNVEVQVQQTVRLDVSLQVGQMTESVEVSSQADLLQAENASVGTVIENKGVTELPLNGRSYLGLVALAANANTLSAPSVTAASRIGGDRASQSISAAGQRIVFDYFTLDGVSNTDPNFQSYVVLPSIDAIQEFKVQTGVYPAEFGHNSTQINVLTKSGGNAYHGALFDFVRNDQFDAIPYAFTSNHPSKSPFKWNDYGFEIDGPVRIPKVFNGKNRLFFMANDEWKKQRQQAQAIYSVPTPAMFTGDFSSILANGTIVYDPNTKTPFTNNVIPSSRLDPISLKFLPYYRSSILPGLSSNYTQLNASPNNRDGFTLRMDWVESANSQWSGRYSWGDENLATTGLSIAGSKILTNYEQYLGTNTRTFSPTLVNEARYGYTRFFNSLGTYTAYSTDTVTAIGIPGLKPGASSTWGVPAIVLNGDGFSGFGDNSDGPYVNSNNTLQFVDNMSWIHGKHTVRFGFEYTRQNFDQVGNQFSRGQFSFQPSTTQSAAHTGGYSFAEFLLGNLYQSSVAVSIANATFQRNNYAAFVDDTWKATSKLTFSLGLRYELTPPWNDTQENMFNVAIPQIYHGPAAPSSVKYPFFVRQGSCTDPYAGLTIHWTVTAAACSNGAYPNQLLKTRYDDFAPRIGISWSPDSKTVARIGFGTFFNEDIANPYFDMARNIAARVTLTSSAATQLVWANAVPGGSAAIAQIPPPQAFAMSYDHHTSYAMQFVLNVQRQLPGNWLIEAGYLGGESHHLYGQQNANQGTPGPVATAASRLPFNTFGFLQLVQDGGNANYNSLSLKATRRFTDGLSVIASYTWSKSIDDTSGIRPGPSDFLYPENSNCIECERGLSGFDVRHRIVTSALYELPVGKGRMLNIDNKVLNGVIGGWQAGGILTLQTGVPGSLMVLVDNAGTTVSSSDRPTATGSPIYPDNPTPSRWINLNAFVEAPQGSWGNVGRNTITGPGIANFDAEVHKQFRMPYKEGHTLQFRVEAFNAINHPNWGMPALGILTGAAQPGAAATAPHQGFGVITSTSTPMRQVQLGLKYSF
jgi:hypothetical protein